MLSRQDLSTKLAAEVLKRWRSDYEERALGEIIMYVCGIDQKIVQESTVQGLIDLINKVLANVHNVLSTKSEGSDNSQEESLSGQVIPKVITLEEVSANKSSLEEYRKKIDVEELEQIVDKLDNPKTYQQPQNTPLTTEQIKDKIRRTRRKVTSDA